MLFLDDIDVFMKPTSFDFFIKRLGDFPIALNITRKWSDYYDDARSVYDVKSKEHNKVVQVTPPHFR